LNLNCKKLCRYLCRQNRIRKIAGISHAQNIIIQDLSDNDSHQAVLVNYLWA
jgi:hypothetical protein